MKNSRRYIFAACSVRLIKFVKGEDLLTLTSADFFTTSSIDGNTTSEYLTESMYFDDYQCYGTFEA